MSSVFPPGVQLAAHYRVLRLLETNHVGALYEAERFDPSFAGVPEGTLPPPPRDGAPLRTVTGRRVALKWLRFAAGSAAQLAHQRAAHARAACAIRHPNLALVHEVALEGSSLFVISELLLGESLRARLAPHAMPMHERLRALAEAMSAVSFAHQRGLVHGGLHPGNIFLHQAHDPCFGLPPVVKVHDFGTATTTLPQSLAYPGERSPFGPHAYLDHAQLCGAEADARSDLYACGVMLYQALTGAVPFAASGPVELAIKLATTSAPPIGDRHPGLPASLDALIQQALRKERSERPLTLEPLAALTSAYAETLAARELLSRGEPSLATRRMIQPSRARAEAARLDAQVPSAERETRPLAVVADDASGKVTRLLTVIGADASAPQQPSASAVPQHTTHPPEYLAALQEAEIAAVLELARDEAAHHHTESALPLRHEEFELRPLVELRAEPSAPTSSAPPLPRHTQRGLSAPPVPPLTHARPETTVTMAVPLEDPDFVSSLARPSARLDRVARDDDARVDVTRSERTLRTHQQPARADREPVAQADTHAPRQSSPSVGSAIGPSSARVAREMLEQESVVEISRHPTVVGASQASDANADVPQQGYVEVVARTRARPVFSAGARLDKVTVSATPYGPDEVERGFLSKRVGAWSAAAAAVLVVAGISVTIAMATNHEIEKSAPPALPSVSRASARDEAALARSPREQLDRQAQEAQAEVPRHAAGSPERDEAEVAADSFDERTAALLRLEARPLAAGGAGDDERTDGAVRRVESPAPNERRHHRERERPQRVRPGVSASGARGSTTRADDDYLVGPPPTADQF